MEKIAIIFDCGATNVRVIAMNNYGEWKAGKSFPNQTHPDPYLPGGRIWDVHEIWEKLCAASTEVIARIDPGSVVAVTTTTFGVDGTFLDNQGKLLYPVISWQCDRTVPVMQNISKYIPLEELYKINGVNAYSFNTINKLIWFNENHREIVDQADRFLFMPSLINYFLCSEKYNDRTMAGTSMLTDIASQSLSTFILQKIGIDTRLFQPVGHAGQVIGAITHEASVLTGIPEGTPVCLSGHDTQFAIFGSGANIHQPVLSSGTWEILMTRSARYSTTPLQLTTGITTEFDALEGLYNIGLNWLASGIIEWIRSRFFAGCNDESCYDTMIEEARLAPPGSNGVFVNPDFTGINTKTLKGSLGGLTMNTSRGEIMRAAFEALAFQTKVALDALENAGDFKARNLICVGGGSINTFWNQLRADVTGIPVITIDQKETTALGASLFAFAAAGLYHTPEHAREQVNYRTQTIFPSEESKLYSELFHQWKQKINL